MYIRCPVHCSTVPLLTVRQHEYEFEIDYGFENEFIAMSIYLNTMSMSLSDHQPCLSAQWHVPGPTTEALIRAREMGTKEKNLKAKSTTVKRQKRRL